MMNNKKTLAAAIATATLSSTASAFECLNPSSRSYGIQEVGHPTNDQPLLEQGLNSWLFTDSEVGAILSCTDKSSNKLVGLQLGLSRPMKELPFDTEPIPEADLHRWWLNAYGNTNIDETTSCSVFYVERGSYIDFVRIDGSSQAGIERFEARTTASSNNLLVSGSAPEGSSWKEWDFKQGSEQFVGLFGNSGSTFIPALGVITMDSQSCTYESSELKANDLKEDWTVPAFVLASRPVIEPEVVVEEATGLGSGPIAGIACGAAVVIAAIITLIVCLCKRKADKSLISVRPKFTVNDIEAGEERVARQPDEWEQTIQEAHLVAQIDELAKDGKGKRAKSLVPNDSAQKLPDYPTDSEYKKEPRGHSLMS